MRARQHHPPDSEGAEDNPPTDIVQIVVLARVLVGPRAAGPRPLRLRLRLRRLLRLLLHRRLRGQLALHVRVQLRRLGGELERSL